MFYKKQNRVQHNSYCCTKCFITDVLDTLFDEDLDNDNVHIISDKFTTENLIKIICQTTVNGFEFSLELIDFTLLNDEIDDYRITIFNDGAIYVEPAIDEDAEYYDCDGFIFIESELNEDAYNGRNKDCNVMVFSIEEQ